MIRRRAIENLHDISDCYEIEALRGECSDAAMMRDYDRFASLFTQDGAWRIPDANVEFVSRDEIRAGIERAQAFWRYFVQTTHPGTIRLEGDTAVGRAYVSEFGRFRDGSSQMMYAIYHDRYQRTSEGWKFAERVYEIRYLDTTQLAGNGRTHGDPDLRRALPPSASQSAPENNTHRVHGPGRSRPRGRRP